MRLVAVNHRMVITNEMLGKFCSTLYPRSRSWKSNVDIVKVGIPSQIAVDMEAFSTDAKSPWVTAAMMVSVAPFGPKVSCELSSFEERYITSTAIIEQYDHVMPLPPPVV